MRIYKGDHGPPAVVKQEEAAVGTAIKAAFKQVGEPRMVQTIVVHAVLACINLVVSAQAVCNS